MNRLKKRKKARFTIKKLVFSLLALFILIFIGLVEWYRVIQAPYWKEQLAAEKIAYAQTTLSSIDTAERFVGDAPYFIFFGKNKEQQPVIVWVENEIAVMRLQADGLSFAQIKQLTLQAHSSAHIMRIVPGVMNDTLVWEVLYQVNENGRMLSKYDYYS
ncbi:MAG: hypothetical protein A2189_08055, partial [Paenibacillus sp. RIFOXYA1_FULL_44_5]